MAYNGWTNKETWLVYVWFGDNFAELAEDGENITPEYIKEYIESIIDDSGNSVESGFMADIINTALAEINWNELAEHATFLASDEEEIND